MHYGTKHLIIGLCIIASLGCNPTNRFYRLVTKHPYLLDSFRQTKVIVRNSVLVDTQIIWSKEIDTLIFRESKIERRNDTFRFYFRERPCTTFIENTQIVPSKTIEKHFENKGKREQSNWLKTNIYLLIIMLLVLALLINRK